MAQGFEAYQNLYQDIIPSSSGEYDSLKDPCTHGLINLRISGLLAFTTWQQALKENRVWEGKAVCESGSSREFEEWSGQARDFSIKGKKLYFD